VSELLGQPVVVLPYARRGLGAKIIQIILSTFRLLATLAVGFVAGCWYGVSQ